MTALTKTERESLLSELDEFNKRRADKLREIQESAARRGALARDVATGKTGAKEEVMSLAETEREAQIEVDALQITIDETERRWTEDEPYRLEEAKAARRVLATTAATRVTAASRRADEAVAALVAALEERAAAATDVSQFRDVIERDIQPVPHVLGHALAKFGIRKFDPYYQLSPNGPNGFSEQDADALAAVLPPDDPGVAANRQRAEALYAEQRRLQSQHTEIVGPTVTVVNPGRP